METKPNIQNKSIHISYVQRERPYHNIIGTIACSEIPEKGRLLDFGCGTGTILKIIGSKRPDIIRIGIDIDTECLAIAQEKIGRTNLHLYPLMLNSSDDDNLKHLFGTMDTVISSHVIEHVEHPKEFIMWLKKFCKPDSQRLILAVPNPVRPDVIKNAIIKREYSNKGHFQCWDRSHWMNFCAILQPSTVQHFSDEILLPGGTRFKVIQKFGIFLSKIFPWLSFSNISVLRW